MRAVAWGVTDTGMKRDHNEDSYLANAELGLFAVADGMGGHVAGDRASSLAVEILERQIVVAELDEDPTLSPSADDPAGRCLHDAIVYASESIHDLAQRQPELQGMGTTLTALLMHRGRAYLAHVGDSRCYLFRDGTIEQLTVDHTWIEEQLRAGFVTEEEASTSALKHIVTRSVGFERAVTVDLMAMPLMMGDCFLLCSDGLSNYLNTKQLGGFLTRGFYSEVPRRLVDAANKLGGDDNVTCLVVYVANHAE